MREVVIQSWCDECAAVGVDAEGIPVDINWRNREISFDLCEEHMSVIHEMDRVVVAYGHQKPRKYKPRDPDGPKKPVAKMDKYRTEAGVYLCPDCGFEARNPQGLAAHRRYKHEVVAAAS